MSIQLSDNFTFSKLIRFTMPSIVMMIFTSLYGVVDGIFVSNIVGSTAFAAVNLIMPFLMILGTAGFMFGTGGSALVSLTLGQGKKELANRYFSMLIYSVIVLGIIFTIIGIVMLPQVAVWFGADGELLDNCIIYGRTYMAALTPFMLQNCFQSMFVAAEKPHLGLAISVAAGVTNMLLDYVFVYLFRWGIAGAAAATAVSQLVGGIIPLFYFIGKNSSTLRLVKTSIDLKVIMKTCSNGMSEMMTNLSLSFVNMLYNYQLLRLMGENGVVAYGIIMYTTFIFAGTYIGYSIGSAPIVSYNYGADNRDELKNLFRKSFQLIAAASIVLTVAAQITAPVLAGIFVKYDAELLELSIRALRLFSISALFSGFNIYASAFFTALNNGLLSALISFLRTLLFQALMIILLPILIGPDGIWIAVVAAELLALAVSTGLLVSQRKRYGYI